jgi:hypothetical protein
VLNDPDYNRALPWVQTTWADWKRAHPDTDVLKKSISQWASHGFDGG